MLRGSVRVRTTAMAVTVVGVTLLLGAVALVLSLDAALERELRASAAVQASETARTLDSGGDPVAGMAGDDDRALQVLGPAGEVAAATPNLAGEPPMARLTPGETREVDVPFDDDTYLVVAAAASGGRVVLVGYSLDSVGESTRALTLLLAVGLPALLVVVGATAWRVIGRALAPVDAIRAEVDEITGARLDRRVPRPASRDEIGRLADTMNRMLDRLERARARERRFVADASHELRSPIAAIRQQAEVALAHPGAIPAGQLARTAHAESLRMQALVDDLLLLAQADERRLMLRHAVVDLDDLVLAEARRLRSAAGPWPATAARTVDGPAVAATDAVDEGDASVTGAVDGPGVAATDAVDDAGASVRSAVDGTAVAAADAVGGSGASVTGAVDGPGVAPADAVGGPDSSVTGAVDGSAVTGREAVEEAVVIGRSVVEESVVNGGGVVDEAVATVAGAVEGAAGTDGDGVDALPSPGVEVAPGLAVDAGGVSAARVDGDAAALRRVLRNLGDNAARHARGRVALALSEEDGHVVLRVDDDGPGVPAGERGRVFDRFVRLDEARARDGGGSGLGLAIVAEIVAAHGGAVEMTESPLGGARVTVRLPLSTG